MMDRKHTSGTASTSERFEAALQGNLKECDEKLNESFTSSSEDLMSLINSGLRQT